MKAITRTLVALGLSATLVGAALAHPFFGVGITGGPVFPVASSAQSAPPLPVYPHAANAGLAQLPIDALPQVYAEPAIANIIASIMGHGNANAQPMP
ncbi:hypothetical protein BRCH_00268c [Candidatus Burkholderia brachyanthoides]|nr:hypothetical protein BRCH_00268c [Candidatus Burkholderia brachyanthoides]